VRMRPIASRIKAALDAQGRTRGALDVMAALFRGLHTSGKGDTICDRELPSLGLAAPHCSLHSACGRTCRATVVPLGVDGFAAADPREHQTGARIDASLVSRIARRSDLRSGGAPRAEMWCTRANDGKLTIEVSSLFSGRAAINSHQRICGI